MMLHGPLHTIGPLTRGPRAWHGQSHCRQPSIRRRLAAANDPKDSEKPAFEDSSGFKAPEGEPELWWVTKFEERRRKQAEAHPTQSQQPEAHPTQSQQPEFQSEPTDTAQGEQAADSEPSGPDTPSTPASWLTITGQTLRLLLVIWMLLAFPASLEPGGLYSFRLWLIIAVYCAFFSVVVRRHIQFGSLASKSKDKQRSSWFDRLRLLLFILAVVVLHWLVVLRSTRLYFASNTWYEVLGSPALLVAVWLHWRATHDLGQAWDRIVAPRQLVTSGVYAHLQHPIYTSYILLFCGAALLLHSAPSALGFLLVCCLHYAHRTHLERQVLSAAFGQQYKTYESKTRRFIPLLY